MIKMESSFTWLDYSEKDRQEVLNILDLLKKSETRDELGIGVVRDAFSDILFPGTSTIQTRAKYFLFIPWIYKSLEEKKVPSSKIEGRGRKEEIHLIYSLLKSDDHDGIIGKEAKEDLQRLASSIYWNGLEAWGIRLYPYSISDYHRTLDAFYRADRAASHSIDEDMEGVEKRRNWHPGLPSAPDNFPEKASFHLTYEEASYLKERIILRCPDTMLSCLVTSDLQKESVFFPWDHPICPALPEKIKEELFHARNFSETIYGAALLYNLMLAEKARDEDMASNYSDGLIEWAESLKSLRVEFTRWDSEKRFWEIISEHGARPTISTKNFIANWLKIALSPQRAKSVAEDDYARDLIYRREVQLKGKLAKLDNSEALDRWMRLKPKMPGQLKYRWHTAEKIVSDILTGLRGS
jgi:hypothetical protein